MAKKKAKKKVAKKAKREMVLVLSKAKEALKGSGLNVSADTLDALNDRVHDLIERAQARCTDNGRKTVRPYDV